MPAKKKAVAKKKTATRARKPKAASVQTKIYDHKKEELLSRPEVGLQAQFKKVKEPVKYRFDRSLDPELSWDINADREQAEALIARIIESKNIEDARAAAFELKRMSRPFLNWAGKAERHEMTVPTLPLFIHERLSTQAILETLKGHKLNGQLNLLFADPQIDIGDRITKAYEHKDKWVNRMILGDSLLAMNSLLQYESMAGKVQMIYIDPPYGVKFGSNFQPFIRKRDVKHNDDSDFTREPEMVQAYRDTWELGLHSYLTYLRDRLMIAKDLLTPSGSIFVQISDENVHHVRELMDEIFGTDNFVVEIKFYTRSNTQSIDEPIADNLLWYSKNINSIKLKQIFTEKSSKTLDVRYRYLEMLDGSERPMTAEELVDETKIPEGARRFSISMLSSKSGGLSSRFGYDYNGETYYPQAGRFWSTTKQGIDNLFENKRIYIEGKNLKYKLYLDDFGLSSLPNLWDDTVRIYEKNLYVVQSGLLVLQRCILMTTDPGDLVLDPTCGSGTTAYVAEQWGRRWITIDTSRVPLALARQRLLTATFPYFQLQDENYGISGGFKYERKQNKKGEEVGGIVPHITLKSIAQNERPKEEVLVDRPNVLSGVLRVAGPFTLEATIPTPVDIDKDGKEDSGMKSEDIADYKTRMLETLRKVATLRIGNDTIRFRGIKAPARSLSLDAEAEQVEIDLSDLGEEADLQKSLKMKPGKPVAFVFGPENGAVSEKLVHEAAKEANVRNFKHLYVIGFACQDNAMKYISNGEELADIPISYVSASMDLQMGDLLKNQRSSQIFAVTGLPDVELTRLKKKGDTGETLYQVELLGLDTFDPITMETVHRSGDDVPAWFLDCNYNDFAFCVNQAFFPRTSAWDNLKKSLKGIYDDSVWEHLAGSISAPFAAGDEQKICVKVIDDRGNELMVVKDLKYAAVEK